MRVSRLVLWSIILLLLLTNIGTVLLMSNNNSSDQLVMSDREIDRNKPLAEVGNTDINYQSWLNELINQHGEEVLHNMVDSEVVFQLAKQQDLSIEPKIIEREIARMLVMEGVLSEEEKADKVDQWTEQIEYRYYLQELITKDVEVPESEIETYFNEYKRQYQFEDMVQISHILVPTEQEAEYVMTKLEDGESFSGVAKEHSIDEDTASDGGYLGFYSETSSFIPGEYYDVSTELSPGEYSEPQLMDNGYAVIYLHQHLPAIELSYEEAFQEVRQDLALDQLEKNIDAESLWEQTGVNLTYKNANN
ncbi:peptidyl-prolyl cis-trans isomerase [Gracilibacillus caseinilyticus]|uniref:peptidylprolyl isomerase n=1 Tax=Gracilibacillus caseinilyticus TaxID=2932256 RepID=A0ABY4EYL7_9BACI|nr:peptidyl-prolyl cis-trans isomerase [Gracilibacillus caseinilyticus]UOQ49493.1 peptidyl-prolyl cis-trans isomerase [Gracilibacillus caseinilyticus]